MADGRVDQVLGATHIRLHGFARVALQQWQMLMRRRVEDQLRPGGCEDLIDSALVADVGDDYLVGIEQAASGDLELQPVQVRFIVVEQVQRLRAETADLAAQLAADRSARSGDQHPAAGDHGGGLLADHVHLTAAQQAFDPDLPQVRQPRVAFHRGQERRQIPNVQAAGPGRLDDLGQPGCGQRWDGYDAGIRPVRTRYLGERRDRPVDRQPGRPDQARGVIEEANRHQAVVRAAAQRTGERSSGLTGPYDQGPEAGWGAVRPGARQAQHLLLLRSRWRGGRRGGQG